MIGFFINFAESTEVVQESAGGISALGLNWRSFLFQLITFVIVLLILRKFVFGKLIAVLEAREKAVDQSLENAAKIEAELKNTQKTVSKMLSQARQESEELLAASQKEAAQLLESAEAKANDRADHIIKNAKDQIELELSNAQKQLKLETTKLVASATEHIIKEKLDAQKDARIIELALSAAGERD